MKKVAHAVGIVNASRFDSLKAAINEALRLIDFRLNKEIRKIAIKPNLCNYWTSTSGETTDPKIVEALVDIFRAYDTEEISLVESDATVMRVKHAFKMLGYEDLASKKGLRLVNLCEDDLVPIPRRHDLSVLEDFRIKIPKTIVDADLFVSVPKFKLHPLPGLTCALKNQFGCIPIKRKESLHIRLDDIIAGINKVLAPDLIVVDGIICKGKTPKKLNLILASRDPVATDFVAAKIAGLNPKRIGHLVKSEKFGAGSTHATLLGDGWTSFANNFPKRGFSYNVSRKALKQLYGLYLRLLTLEGKIFRLQPAVGG